VHITASYIANLQNECGARDRREVHISTTIAQMKLTQLGCAYCLLYCSKNALLRIVLKGLRYKEVSVFYNLQDSALPFNVLLLKWRIHNTINQVK